MTDIHIIHSGNYIIRHLKDFIVICILSECLIVYISIRVILQTHDLWKQEDRISDFDWKIYQIISPSIYYPKWTIFTCIKAKFSLIWHHRERNMYCSFIALFNFLRIFYFKINKSEGCNIKVKKVKLLYWFTNFVAWW